MLLLQISPATPPPTGPPSPSAQPPGIIMGLCWLVKQHSVLVLFLFAMFCSQVLDIRYRQEKKPNLTYLWSLEDAWNSFPLSLALCRPLTCSFGSLWLALRYFCQSNGLRWHLAKKRQSQLQKLLAFGPTPTLLSLSTPYRPSLSTIADVPAVTYYCRLFASFLSRDSTLSKGHY